MRTSLLLVPALVAAAADAGEDARFALVELYTSEGCSGCPPAERLVGELAREAREGGTRVFVVAFHVDVWDHLGWRDRFGRPEFSDRLRDYGQIAGGRLFTPEVVVNGRWALVGSDERRLREAIGKGVAERTAARLVLKVRSLPKSGTLTVRPLTADVPGTALIAVAVVEDGLATEVRRGENANRRLGHDRVVRAFAVAPVGQAAVGGVKLELPPDLVGPRAEIVAWVESAAGGPVLAATSRPLP